MNQIMRGVATFLAKNNDLGTGIFISYRRLDSEPETHRIATRLQRWFGKRVVFYDTHSIKGGEDFFKVISKYLKKPKVVLVVVGKSWIDAKDPMGNRRLDAAEDTVRREVETALMSCETVIPVFVQNQQVPNKVDLPESIATLFDKNAIHIHPDPHFEDDLNVLVKRIAEIIPKAVPRWIFVSISVTLALVGFNVSYGMFDSIRFLTDEPEAGLREAASHLYVILFVLCLLDLPILFVARERNLRYCSYVFAFVAGAAIGAFSWFLNTPNV